MNGPTILPAAPANTLAADQLRLRPDEDGSLGVTAERAGWRYLGFATRALHKGERMPFRLETSEAAIVVLSGGGVTIEVNGRQPVELAGRRSVFDGLPWAIYLPPGVRGRVIGRPIRGGGQTVIAAAVAPVLGRSGGREPIAITPDDVSVEIRGAGNASRQVNHIITPDFPADRLELVEVLTPGGNWSSWPPHKHDVDAMPDEAVLEEIYLYQFRRAEAWAVQRLYRADRSRDALWEVRHGDLVLVPDGYHPFAAAHGDDAYYLNALAGDRRTMACTDDPDLAWVRGSWDGMAVDPRLPLVQGHAVGSRPSVVPRAEAEDVDARPAGAGSDAWTAPSAAESAAEPRTEAESAAPAGAWESIGEAPTTGAQDAAGGAGAGASDREPASDWASELEHAPDAGTDWSADGDEATTAAVADTDDAETATLGEADAGAEEAATAAEADAGAEEAATAAEADAGAQEAATAAEAFANAPSSATAELDAGGEESIAAAEPDGDGAESIAAAEPDGDGAESITAAEPDTDDAKSTTPAELDADGEASTMTAEVIDELTAEARDGESASAWASEVEHAPEGGTDWSADSAGSTTAVADAGGGDSTTSAVADAGGAESTAADTETDAGGAAPAITAESAAEAEDAAFEAEWARELEAEARAAVAERSTAEREPDAATR